MVQPEHDPRSDGGSGISAGDVARWAPPILLTVVVVAFALANTRSTRVDFIVADTEAPLIVVLLATALIGAVIAALVRRSRRD